MKILTIISYLFLAISLYLFAINMYVMSSLFLSSTFVLDSFAKDYIEIIE